MPRPVVPIAPLPELLARDVEFLVQRQDQRRVLGDAQILGRDRDALFLERGDFVEQRMRVEHHAIADDRQFARPHHAGGQQRKLVGGPVDHQRVAGIMAALEADDDVGLLGEPVDDLAFALVAPLGADHDNICHEELSPRGRRSLTWIGYRPQPTVPDNG